MEINASINFEKKNWFYYNLLLFIQHIVGYDFYKKKFTSIHNNVIDKGIKKRLAVNQSKAMGITLLKQKAANWPAVKKWGFDFFIENYGEENVAINFIPGITDKDAPSSTKKTTLEKYINDLKLGSLNYLKLNDLVNKKKELQKDLDLNWLTSLKKEGSFGETFFYFMGGKNTKTPLHCEFPTTVYIQVEGIKKWTIYRPKERVFLNAKMDRRTYFFSDFNPTDPNEKEFKYQHNAIKTEYILHPGDVLIVPPFYWHFVENLTDSIGVAYKYSNIKSALKSSKLLTLLVFLSTKPFLFYSFFANRILKKDIVTN